MLVESHFSGFVCIVSVTVQSGSHYSSQTIRVGYDLRCCSKKKRKKKRPVSQLYRGECYSQMRMSVAYFSLYRALSLSRLEAYEYELNR